MGIIHITLLIVLIISYSSQFINAVNLRESLLNEFKLTGVSNCESNCRNILSEATTAGVVACTSGCQYCLDDEKYTIPNNDCFTYCKTTNWSSQGICKDTIEPDKACMLGCITSLCQGTLCVGCSTSSNNNCCYKSTYSYEGVKYPGCQSPTAKSCNECTPDCKKYPTETACN